MVNRSDIYSLGAIICEIMLANNTSFHSVKQGNYTELEDSTYSPFLKQLIKAMLSIRPDKRPSAQIVLEIINNYEIKQQCQSQEEEN